MSSHDLRRVLDGWPYKNGEIAVRKVNGSDGKIKIQMRLDLGVMQMEVMGRPDGLRPNGLESLLHYHFRRLADHIRRNGTELGFSLSADECQAVREEAMLYYHRYLSLFVLEDFDGVTRDTARNLRALDLCRKYAMDESDKMALEQYRPYLVMMNSRARAHMALDQKNIPTAIAAIDRGLERIRTFFEEVGHPEYLEESGEVAILRAFRRDVVGSQPKDKMTRLEEKLQTAVAEERFEDAAALRDQIAALRQKSRQRVVRPRRRAT